MALPLSPYRVVEVAAASASLLHREALALAGKIMGDLGATVLKIVPPGGDPLHRVPVLPWEETAEPLALGAFLDTSKQFVELDLARPGDRNLLEMLVADAQVILTDGPATGMADPERQVAVTVSALPPGSPLAGTPMSDLTLLALSGLLDIVGDPAREPLMLGGHQAARAAGLALFSAAATGLAGLDLHGVGDRLEVDILDVLIWVNWKGVGATAFRAGEATSREGAAAEWQVNRCADGWIAMVYNNRDWPALARLVDHPSLLDPKLNNPNERAARRGEYGPAIAAWCSGRTREEIQAVAQARKVPVGPVVDPAELPNDPQVAARQSIARVPASGSAGSLAMPLVPMLMNGERFLPRPSVRVANPRGLRQ